MTVRNMRSYLRTRSSAVLIIAVAILVVSSALGAPFSLARMVRNAFPVTMDQNAALAAEDCGGYGYGYGYGYDCPADLELTKDVDRQTASQGSNIQYDIRVTNNGPGGATDVEVFDDLPSGLTHSSSTAQGGTCTYDSNSHSVLCELGDLAPGESRLIRINGQVTGQPGNTMNNEAEVDANEPDPAPDNNNDDANTTILSQGETQPPGGTPGSTTPPPTSPSPTSPSPSSPSPTQSTVRPSPSTTSPSPTVTTSPTPGDIIRHFRRISLNFDPPNNPGGTLRMKGRVRSDMAACFANVPVQIQRRHKGKWILIGNTTTNANGRYSVPATNLNDKYRAIAPRVRLDQPDGGADICMKARKVKTYLRGR